MLASYRFHGDLPRMLRSRWRSMNPIVQPVTRAASIKDAIEAFGPPHTDIGALVCDGRPIDFSWPVAAGQHFDIFPVVPPWDVTRPTLLRPNPLPTLGFLVDSTGGRLARYLRMAGFDTLYDPAWHDQDILQAMAQEPRLLLSRNLDLLKRKAIEFGRAIRAHRPTEQLREVLHLFGIEQPPHPFTRCLDCNGLLEPIPKAAILHRLEPLTQRYFDTFHCCRRCDKLYWPGSHVDRMRGLLSDEPFAT